MYHAVYPQMVYALNPQEAGMPGSSIPLYNGMQFLSLSNSQDNCHFFNNSFNVPGPTIARHRTPSPVYGQNNTAPNQGDVLKNQQQTNVLAISNSNNIVPLSNSIDKNHIHIGNNQYNPEIIPLFDQSSQRLPQNYSGTNKQSGKNKEKKNSTQSRQNGYNNTKNNHKQQTYTVYSNNDKQQNQNKHQNGTKKPENQNNNNYQQHNRNNFNNGFRKNWGWQNKQRNQNKNYQSVGSVSSNSSSSSARMSPVSPSLTEIQTHMKKDLEEPSFYHTNIQNTPRKSPTLGEYMLQTLIVKDRDGKHCSKSLPIKFSNLNISEEDLPMVAINNCIFNESWPDHYSFSNHQPYYHHRGFRFNQFEVKRTFNNHQFINNCNSQNRKRDNKNNKSLLSLRDHRFGACYQRTRRFHIALAKGQKTNDEALKPIGHSIPYSLHNLYELHIYYNLTPFENIPFYSQNFFVPADRFIAKALVSNNADKINKNDPLSCSDKLSKSIWAKYLLVQQTSDTYISKLMLWKYLFLFIKNFHARYSLFLVGSTMTGFASNSSDVDFCLIVKNSEIDQRNEAHLHLDNLYKLITINASDYFYDVRLFPAKVPILRFHDCAQELDVDLNCNNFVGIRNTHLLHCYSQLNWKVKPLVMIVKQWARANQMNSARESTISSYSLTLMVIHYLQCGVQPPILPCLHNMFPGKFENYSDIHSIDIHEKMEPYKTDNKMSLGELLLGFFEYYSGFDYPSYAISVRKANVIKVESCKHEPMPKNDPTQWMYICIEEPFDRTNTARSVYLYNMFLYIKKVFQLSHLKLKQTHDLERVMNLGLPIPEIRSTSPLPKGPSALKTEYKWPNKYKNIVDNDTSQQRKIELAG